MFRQPLTGWVVGLALVTCIMVASSAQESADESQTLDTYRAAWLERERNARNEADRAQLAGDLLAAAKQAADSDATLAVFMCRRAYHFASQQRPSFAVGAQALELMAKVDPSLTIESLEKVRDLYQLAYRENPTVNIGMGMRTAEATALVARERRLMIDAQLGAGEITPSQLLVEANRIVREWEQARRSASAAINSAQSVHRRLVARDAANAALVSAFITEHERSLVHYEGELRRANRFKDVAVQLNQAQRTLDQSPDSVGAQAAVGRLYLLGLDAPVPAKPLAASFLDPRGQKMLGLVTEADPTPQQRVEVARWYLDLAGQATDPAHQRVAINRSRAMLRGCDEAFAPDDQHLAGAQALAEAVNEQLRVHRIGGEPVQISPRPIRVAVATPPRRDPAPREPAPRDPVRSNPTPNRITFDREEPRDSQPPASPAEPPLAANTGTAAEPDPRFRRPAVAAPINDDEDDSYWSNRRGSIFEFGRD